MGRRFSGKSSGGGGGRRSRTDLLVQRDWFADQRLRDRDKNLQPYHVGDGFPHFAKRSSRCMCFRPCCFGSSGCICPGCPCDKRIGHVNGEVRRIKYRDCFACGDPATTVVEGEPSCVSCAEEYQLLRTG